MFADEMYGCQCRKFYECHHKKVRKRMRHAHMFFVMMTSQLSRGKIKLHITYLLLFLEI